MRIFIQSIDAFRERRESACDLALLIEPSQWLAITVEDTDVAFVSACPYSAVMPATDGAHGFVGHDGPEKQMLLLEGDLHQTFGGREPNVMLVVGKIQLNGWQTCCIGQVELFLMPLRFQKGIRLGCVGDGLIATGLGVEKIDVAVIGPNHEVVQTVGTYLENAVGGKGVHSGLGWIKSGELVTIVAAQTIPCGQPDESLAVLLNARDFVGR